MSKNKFKLLRRVDTNVYNVHNYYTIYDLIIISYCYIVIRHLQGFVLQPVNLPNFLKYFKCKDI